MQASVRSFFLIILSIITFIGNSFSQERNDIIEFTPVLIGKYFYWGEYNDNSYQIIEEEGNLYGFGLISKFKLSKSFKAYIKLESDFYYGIVDYNGFLQDSQGNTEAYKSETVYAGVKTTLNIGYDFYILQNFIFAPEFGFQHEYWNRDVDNGGQYGYDENYNMFLFNIGCNFITFITSNTIIFIKVLGEYPLQIDETIDFASRGHDGPAEINLAPKPNTGLNIELGFNIYGSYISLYFDYIIFSPSLFNQGYYQPESDKSIVGFKLGYTF